MINLTITSNAEKDILKQTERIKEFGHYIQSVSGEELKLAMLWIERNEYKVKEFLSKPLESRRAEVLSYKDSGNTNFKLTGDGAKTNNEIRKELMSKVKEKCLGQIKLSIGEGVKSAIVDDIKSEGVNGGLIAKLVIGPSGKEKKFMVKGLYVQNGKYLYKPNAKNDIGAFFTRQTVEQANAAVIEEYIALKLANLIRPGIAPDVKLGKIERGEGKDNTVQYCILTEMAGQGDGEKFHTLDEFVNLDGVDKGDKTLGIDKEIWKAGYAICTLILNDCDAGGKKNIGAVTGEKGGTNLSLFDLGHPDPNKYKLDPNTLLPKSTSVFADIMLWVINLFVHVGSIPGTFKLEKEIKDSLTVDEREAAIRHVLGLPNSVNGVTDKAADQSNASVGEGLSKKIIGELDKLANEFDDGKDKAVINEFKEKVNNRIEYLETVLREHEKIENEKVKQHTKNA